MYTVKTSDAHINVARVSNNEVKMQINPKLQNFKNSKHYASGTFS